MLGVEQQALDLERLLEEPDGRRVFGARGGPSGRARNVILATSRLCSPKSRRRRYSALR